MNVLMITGDKRLLQEDSDAYKRLQLQRGAVERLDVVYWGRGALTHAFSVRGTYDVVTAQDPLWRGLVAWWVAKRNRATLNVQVHMDLDALTFVHHVVAQIVLRHADTIRVVSQRIRQQVERIGVRAKIAVLPIYIDPDRFRAVVRREHQGKNILWIGRFEKEKAPEEAVAVWKAVREGSVDARLILLGAGSLYARVEQLRMQSVRDMGDVGFEIKDWQDPTHYLALADVVLCTSHHESWGASMIEALAAGVPVVAPDVGVAKEIGATVVPREKLAEAVTDVLRRGVRGELKGTFLPAEAWAHAWRDSLI